MLGWDGVKDDKGRKLLADLKIALKEYGDLPFHYMDQEYERFVQSDKDILILQTREFDEIKKAQTLLGAKSVFIENEHVQNVLTNVNDASIIDVGYDYYIKNNGTLAEYEQAVVDFIQRLEELRE